jgi:hypothetical protein
MKFNPKIHHRRSIRLKGYDYSQAGAYFVTIVAWRRECLFGDIVNGEMDLNEFGEIVSQKWQWLETQYEYIELGAWVVMPNHLHGILIIHDDGRGGSRPAPTLSYNRLMADITPNPKRPLKVFLCHAPRSVIKSLVRFEQIL